MSTLAVNTITAETGNTVSLASGKTLNASQGFTPPAGHVIQVQQKVLSRAARSATSIIEGNTGVGANVTTTSTSWVSTGITQAITIQANNKILMQAAISDIVSQTEAASVGFAFYINGTEVNIISSHAGYGGAVTERHHVNGVFLSKALAAGTYTIDVRWRVTSSTAYFLNGHTSSNSESSLILQEIQA